MFTIVNKESAQRHPGSPSCIASVEALRGPRRGAQTGAMDLDELGFHPWVAQGPPQVPTFVGGTGSHVVDENGRRYLDFSSQLVFANLGHQHPRIVEAIKAQADRLCTLAPSHASDIRGEAARLIVDVAPEGLGHVLFTT